jgi:hypothetical protein
VAYEIPGFQFTLVAGEDLRTSQFCAVDVNGSGLAITPTADGARAIGVCLNKPNTGEPTSIVVSGVTKAKAGVGGMTAGAGVRVMTDGRFTAEAAASHSVGVALKTVAVNEIGTVLLLNAGPGAIKA